MRHPCQLCAKPIDPLQVRSGLEWDGVIYDGHYRCVLTALGPAALPAIQAGRLPLFRDDELTEAGELRSMVAKYPRGRRPRAVSPSASRILHTEAGLGPPDTPKRS
jgi:hypothetical protein